jgi:hypothetical protein
MTADPSGLRVTSDEQANIRRSAPMKRSAIALARGARTGVRMMPMSAPTNTGHYRRRTGIP